MPSWLMWLTVGVCLAGNVLVVKRRRFGFMCWAVSNVALASYSILAREWALVLLFNVYFALAVWGWWSWRPNIAAR